MLKCGQEITSLLFWIYYVGYVTVAVVHRYILHSAR